MATERYDTEGKNDEYTNAQRKGEWRELLKEWECDEFIQNFAAYGWTAPIDWHQMESSDFTELGMKRGHIVRFKRCLKEYYAKQNINCIKKSAADNLTTGTVYAIKSISSGYYLDGRGGQKEPLMTNRNPKGDKYLNWIIIKTNIGYALKSVSSGYFLDGRGGHKDPLMTNRDPTNDKYLNWTFEETNGDHIAIKSVSSSYYLDGRAGQSDPLMTNRVPMKDKFLQWTFVAM
eukprot:1168217_1